MDGTLDGPQPDDATPSDSGGGAMDAALDSAVDGGDAQTIQPGCATSTPGCYTVYAHSSDTLYYLDQTAKALVTVGGFQAPAPIVDLAVTPDNVIWVISTTAFYTANPATGYLIRAARAASWFAD
jgi:hypothetical protein